MKSFAIVLAVFLAMATFVGIMSLIHGFSNNYAVEAAEGTAVLSFAPVALLLCFVVILLADIRAALTVPKPAKEKEVGGLL